MIPRHRCDGVSPASDAGRRPAHPGCHSGRRRCNFRKSVRRAHARSPDCSGGAAPAPTRLLTNSSRARRRVPFSLPHSGHGPLTDTYGEVGVCVTIVRHMLEMSWILATQGKNVVTVHGSRGPLGRLRRDRRSDTIHSSTSIFQSRHNIWGPLYCPATTYGLRPRERLRSRNLSGRSPPSAYPETRCPSMVAHPWSSRLRSTSMATNSLGLPAVSANTHTR